MRRIPRTRLALAGLVLAAAAIALSAVVAQAGNKHHPSAFEALRAASAKYHDISVAQGAGYSLLRDAQNIACIDNQPVGGMGVHWVNGGVGDTQLDPLNPEALVYAPDLAEPPGSKLARGPDVLMVGAATRERAVKDHMPMTESIACARRLKPARTLFTHIGHRLGTHAELEAWVPEGFGIAHDGLELGYQVTHPPA